MHLSWEGYVAQAALRCMGCQSSGHSLRTVLQQLVCMGPQPLALTLWRGGQLPRCRAATRGGLIELWRLMLILPGRLQGQRHARLAAHPAPVDTPA